MKVSREANGAMAGATPSHHVYLLPRPWGDWSLYPSGVAQLNRAACAGLLVLPPGRAHLGRIGLDLEAYHARIERTDWSGTAAYGSIVSW
jgi:hypothetical protein